MAVVSALSVLAAGTVRAEEPVKVEAVLIWGTNMEQPPDGKYVKIDKMTSGELKQAFKWDHYYIIRSEQAILKKKESKELKMSPQCRLEIKYLGSDHFEVLVWGTDPKTKKETKVAKGSQKMPLGEKVFLMGLNDNESSWFVKLCRKD